MDGRAVGVIEGGLLYSIRTDWIGRPSFATDSSGVKVYGYALQNPGRYVDPRGEQVFVLCRPLEPMGVPINQVKHCAIFVISIDCPCGPEGFKQFSLGGGDRRFNQSPDVFATDLKYWKLRSQWWHDVSVYPVPVPWGMDECEFDLRVIEEGIRYTASTYSNPFGPNSNTAVTTTISRAGGQSPLLKQAPGQGFRE